MKYLALLALIAGIALLGVFPRSSLLGLLGAILLVDAVVALLVLSVRALARPSSSRGSQVRGALVVAGCALAALFIFQRLTSRDDSEAIGRTIRTVAMSTDPSFCDYLVTPRYLRQVTGEKPPYGEIRCASDAASPRAEAVEAITSNVEGDRATASATFIGGSFDDSRLDLTLVEESGRWKLDRVVGFQAFNRVLFERAYRMQLWQYGTSKGGVSCSLAKLEKLPDAEIERQVLSRSSLFATIAVECDREAVERRVVAAAADPSVHASPKSIECVARKTRNSGTRTLMSLQVKTAAYARLLRSCGIGSFDRYVTEAESGGS